MKLLKKFVCILFSFAIIAMIAGCSGNQTKQPNGTTPTDSTASVPDKSEANSKALIAYFFCTGTTKGVAESIANETGGTLYEIMPEKPYSDAELNYSNSDSRATKEQNDSAVRPAISGTVDKMEQYDIVFIGYPIWWGQAPRIINTFLESYDFSGKIIIPFCTSHSSGIGSSDTDLHRLVSDTAIWKDGKRFSGNADKSEVAEWIASLDLNMAEQTVSLPYDGVYPEHEPYGTGVGTMPGRVVWSHNPDSVKWDGDGYWWELDNFDEAVIQKMVNDSIASLGGKDTATAGWNALFENRNERNGKSGGYAKGQKIAIKANINGSAVMDDDTSGETKMSYTNPVLLKALLVSLVNEAGVAPADITVYDVSRLFPDYMVELCTEGILKGVNFVDRNTGIADKNTPIGWSYEFSGKVNYVPTCVTEATYVINLANLKGHTFGITLCGKNHFGSFINGNTTRPPEGANLHQWMTKNEMGIYSPLVDLMVSYQYGDKTVLYMLDAVICATSEGSSMTGSNTKWQQSPFNNDYTSSIFVSQDPVAIESVGADFLMNEPTVTENNSSLKNNPTVENYLHEAGLIGNAPSGTIYTNGNGKKVTNAGVHEHWNNSSQKQYSRNLGKKEGIELIYIK